MVIEYFLEQPGGLLLTVFSLVLLNLFLACILYGCLKLILRYLVKKMDIQLGYLLVRICVLAFLIPLISCWEIGLSVSESYWLSWLSLRQEIWKWVILSMAVVWIFGIAATLSRCVHHRQKLRRILLTGAAPARKEWTELLVTLCRERNIKIPACREQMGVQTAFVMGVLHPVICVPDGRFSEEERRVILTHELTHIQERDLLWKQLVQFCKIVFWFCLPIYSLAKEVDEWSEFNCDFVSCKVMGSAGDYFDILMNIAGQEYVWNCTALTARFGGDLSEISRRMKAMINQRYISRRRMRWVFILALIFLFFGSSTASAASFSVITEYREFRWEEADVVIEEGDVLRSERYFPTSDQMEYIRENCIYVEKWSTFKDCWMLADPSRSGGFNWVEAPGQVFGSQPLTIRAGEELALGCVVEPMGIDAVGGMIGPDGEMQCFRMNYDGYCRFSVERTGEYRFFIWNISGQTEELFGYYIVVY